jgi:hypothetical protein
MTDLTKKQAEILKYLAKKPNGWHTRSDMVDRGRTRNNNFSRALGAIKNARRGTLLNRGFVRFRRQGKEEIEYQITSEGRTASQG